MSGPGPENSLHSAHLDPNDIAAYLDGALEEGARARVETHLAECETCRAEVVAVRRLVAHAPRRRRWIAFTTFAAAAAVVLFLIWPRSGQLRAPGGPIVRDGETEGATVAVIGPDSIAPSPLAFIWHSVGNATSYRVSLTTSTGELVWSATSSDTAIVVPDSVMLSPGASYYYYIDVLLADGTSGTSGVRPVRVHP